MSPETLAEIEARANAASEGPWKMRENSHGGITLLRGEETASVSSRHPQSHLQVAPTEDGEFIAHSRQDVPALVQEVKRLKALVEAAYKEGHNEGIGDGHPLAYHKSSQERWKDSSAFDALEAE